jgi:hypothetical protein
MPNLSDYTNPTEEQEQMALCQWLTLKKLDFFHVPNNTYTKFHNVKRRNTAMGVKSGVPDLFVVIPQNPNADVEIKVWRIKYRGSNTTNEVKLTPHRLVAIEMKRKKGGTVSKEQKQWLEILNDAGIESVVCRGAQSAIDFVTDRVLKSGQFDEARKWIEERL